MCYWIHQWAHYLRHLRARQFCTPHEQFRRRFLRQCRQGSAWGILLIPDFLRILGDKELSRSVPVTLGLRIRTATLYRETRLRESR